MGVLLSDLVKTGIDNEFGTLYLVKIENEKDVAVFTVNTPWRMLATGVIETMHAALDAAAGDAAIGGFVTYNEQGPFSNGFDLRVIRDLMNLFETDETAAEAKARGIATAGHALFDRLYTFPKPTIAAVGGWARGGGYEFALAHSYIMGADNTNVDDPLKPWFFKVQLPEVKQVGLIPGWNGIPFLMKRVIAAKLAEKPDATQEQQEKLYAGVMKTVVEPVIINAYGPDNAGLAAKKAFIDEAVERKWSENLNNGVLLEEAIYRALDFADSYTPKTLGPMMLKPAPSPSIQSAMDNPQTPADYAYRCMFSTLKDGAGTPIEETRTWDVVSDYSLQGILELAKQPARREALRKYIDSSLTFLDGLDKGLLDQGVNMGWH